MVNKTWFGQEFLNRLQLFNGPKCREKPQPSAFNFMEKIVSMDRPVIDSPKNIVRKKNSILKMQEIEIIHFFFTNTTPSWKQAFKIIKMTK